jgi:hypothetical protein
LNPSANRKIEKNDFQRLPLIQKLVDHFETLFPHLAIEQVWLLQKSKDGDGFQGWHQDMVERITNTILINLGSEDNSNKLAADEVFRQAQPMSWTLTWKKEHLLMITIPMFTQIIPFVICSKHSNSDEELKARSQCFKGNEAVWYSLYEKRMWKRGNSNTEGRLLD